MRQGLVLAGLSLALLGGLVLGVAALNLPTGNTFSSGSPSSTPDLPPGHELLVQAPLPSRVSKTGTLNVTFRSDGKVTVTILECSTADCTGCLTSETCPVQAQTVGASGWLQSPMTDTPDWYVLLVNSGTQDVNASLSITSSFTVTSGLSGWQDYVLFTAGAVLISFGLVSAFLGAFLRRGIFSGKPAPVPAAPGDVSPASGGKEETGHDEPSPVSEPATGPEPPSST